MSDAQTQKQLATIKKKDEAYALICAREAKAQQESAAVRRAEIERLARIEHTRAQSSLNAASVFGVGYLGYGNGLTEIRPSRILYPKERKRPRRHMKEITFPREALHRVAQVEEVLVPVRLDLDFDKYKLRDTFTWNLNDTTVPLELFAEHLCEDYQLPRSGFAVEVSKSLKAQLAEHHPHKFPDEQEGNTIEATQQATSVYTETRDDDLRIPVKIDITLGTVNLIDQFEWDINNSKNDAESFAENFCAELGLASEFRTAVAHAIREQCQLYTKSLFLVGHTFDGKAVQDNDMKQMIMPPLYAPLRPKHMMDKFAPALYEMTSDQLERIEREREREGRRNRRQTRGKRGANLPDLGDLPKTYRTPYNNRVLGADEDRWADKYATVRAPVPGTADKEDFSDFDDRLDNRNRDKDSPMTDREIRSLRGHKSSASNSTPQLQKARNHATSHQYVERPTSLNHMQSTLSSSHARQHQVTATQRTDGVSPAKPANPLPRKNPRAPSPSPEPSLIVKLKIPRLRQLRQVPKAVQQRRVSYEQSLAQSTDSHLVPDGTHQNFHDIPPAMLEHIRRLHESFPRDSFEPIVKLNQHGGEPMIRIRCFSCPGYLYYVNDFEVHLRNRNHRMRVDQGQNGVAPNQ